MNIAINQFEIRLLIALFLGAIIGLERQWQHKTAGIKTNALVSLGAALFVLLANEINGDSSSESRIIAQIVSGIGFLGAGAIMKEGLNISGLNTAATIWCAGAIGSLSGLGMTYEAIYGTLILVLANIALRSISNKIETKFNHNLFHIKIEIELDESVFFNIEHLIKNQKDDVYITSSETLLSPNQRKLLIIEIKGNHILQAELENQINEFNQLPGLHRIKWNRVILK